MFTNFSEFVSCVKEARFTFDVVWQWISSVFKDIAADPDVLAIWNGLMRAVTPIHIFFVTLLIGFCLVSAFFGKKIIGVIKFCAFFVAGFGIGAHFLSPLLPPQINIPSWIIGLVFALIVAVLSRFLYLLLYSVIFGYGTYVLVFYGFFLNKTAAYSPGKAVGCVIMAIIVLVLALVFRKYIEMALTSFLGAWGETLLFTYQIYNFAAWSIFGGNEVVGILVLTLVLTALGLIVQIKTRRRY